MNEKDIDFPTTTVDDTITDTDGGTVPATVPAQPRINPFVAFRQRNSGGGGFFRGPLIKLNHSTGKFWRSRGGTAIAEVDPDERFVVNVHEMIDSWTKFIDGKSVNRKVYRTVDGEFAPEREALGDNDPDEWPTKNNRPKDPWQRQVFLPMKGDDGEVCAFSATGASAIAEIGEIVGMYGSADRHGKLPIVELETRTFESQHGNTIYVPVFRLVGWQFWEPNTPAPPVQLVPVSNTPPPKAIAKREDDTDTDDMSDAAPAKPYKPRDLDDDIPFALAAMAAIPLLTALSGLGGLFA